jgi:hypothetical protein
MNIKNNLLTVFFTAAISGHALAADVNVPRTQIDSIAVNSSGHHALFLSSHTVIPNPDGCDLTNRVIVFENGSVAGKTLIDTAMKAMNKPYRHSVLIKIDGCVDATGNSGLTAPKVARIRMFY